MDLIAKRWSLHLCKLWLIYATSVRHVMAKPENILITPIVKKLQSETFHFLLNNGNVSVNLLGGCRKVNHTYFSNLRCHRWKFFFFVLFIWKVFSRKKFFFFENQNKTKIFSHSSHTTTGKSRQDSSLLIKVGHFSEIRGLCLMKWSSKMLQNLPYFWNKKTQVVYFNLLYFFPCQVFIH